MGFVIVLLFIALFIGAIASLLKGNLNPKRFTYSKNEYILTKAEASFDGVLNQAIGHRFRICPKVRIADVLKPTPFSLPAFNAIAQKHFDWIITDPNTSAILCAIELDDSTHDMLKARKRDTFVNDACKTSGLKLVRFTAKRSYSIQEVSKAILTPA